MAESDADTYYGQKATECRQLAWLTRQFYDALILPMPAAGDVPASPPLPEALAHDIALSWFDYELAESELVIDDDD